MYNLTCSSCLCSPFKKLLCNHHLTLIPLHVFMVCDWWISSISTPLVRVHQSGWDCSCHGVWWIKRMNANLTPCGFRGNKLSPKIGYSSSPSWCLHALVDFVCFWKLSLWCSLHWLEKQKLQWKWPKLKLSCSIIYFGHGTKFDAYTF